MKLDDLYEALRYIASVALEPYEIDEFESQIENGGKSQEDYAHGLHYTASITLGSRESEEFKQTLRLNDLEDLRAATNHLASLILTSGHIREFHTSFPYIGTPEVMTETESEPESISEPVDQEPETVMTFDDEGEVQEE